jgi:predicted Zn-dependent protease
MAIERVHTGVRALLGVGLLVGMMVACATSPTGRSQVLLYSDVELDQMGAASFEQQKSEVPVTGDASTSAYVECISKAIVAQLPEGQRDGWEVLVFDSPQVNAFALPGRKIGVYAGLLQVATTQDQLAAVIGHEVGHVLARHGNERVSQVTLAQMSQAAVAAAVQSSDMSSETGQLVMAGFGMGAQYGVLMPFSRSHESEADVIGLDLMARAGFDPEASVTLWQRMSAASGGEAPPEWASTHPSNESRIANLRSHMEGARALSAQARAAGRVPRCRR